MSVFQTLGIAYKARKILLGDTLITAIRKSKVSLLLIAKDCGEATRKKILDKCRSFNVKYIEYGSKIELGHALGKSQISSIGIIDEGFAKLILKALTSL
jgi:ribosomal protein L7Ae-like RNA K-turn-binding protein